jgi:hypothetical protein
MGCKFYALKNENHNLLKRRLNDSFCWNGNEKLATQLLEIIDYLLERRFHHWFGSIQRWLVTAYLMRKRWCMICCGWNVKKWNVLRETEQKILCAHRSAYGSYINVSHEESKKKNGSYLICLTARLALSFNTLMMRSFKRSSKS